MRSAAGYLRHVVEDPHVNALEADRRQLLVHWRVVRVGCDKGEEETGVAPVDFTGLVTLVHAGHWEAGGCRLAAATGTSIHLPPTIAAQRTHMVHAFARAPPEAFAGLSPEDRLPMVSAAYNVLERVLTLKAGLVVASLPYSRTNPASITVCTCTRSDADTTKRDSRESNSTPW